MDIFTTIKLAIRSITGNKMRSILTMLGIIIGVSAVIIMVSLTQGATNSVTEEIESMGSNLLTINIRRDYIGNTDLNYYDLKDFENLENIAVSTPIVSGGVTAKYISDTYDTTVTGADSSIMESKNFEVTSGRFIVPLDVTARNNVAVVGTTIITELFADADPLGKDVLLNGSVYTIIGVLAEKSADFDDPNDQFIIPISSAQTLLSQSFISQIYVSATSDETVSLAETEVTDYLTEIYGTEDAYRIFNQQSLLDTIGTVTQTLSLMLGGIAAISLLVGGIGIMNIMLVSVTERTREIGIRKAIGSKRSAILKQFLIESSIVSGIGGIIGVIIGVAGSYGIGKLIKIDATAPLYIVLISFGFSLIVGLFFGIYPANKAAKLKPVDALRYE